ncbi:holo-ACP synthase [Pararhodobacter sp. SW119]|uniref:holo-ACP synthase n=1 Tax=Pararhodobacter sp. SW119 TaxID=2780075 RepID=UPI001AE0ACB5|nr:holo-ACP synthase [Pararhodobacter sp. SW119]
MILGIGADLANIERIEATLARFGSRFINRVFTAEEIETANRRQRRAATLARRWAAKEACAKALGTGLRMGVGWRDMSVSNRDIGQPHLVLTGWAAKRLQAMTPPDHEAVVHLSISDDHPWAQAFVVIEARAIGPSGRSTP